MGAFAKSEIKRWATETGETKLLLEITPDAANGEVDLSSEFSEVYPLAAFHVADVGTPATDSIDIQMEINGSEDAQIDFSLWAGDGGAAATFRKIRVLVHAIT